MDIERVFALAESIRVGANALAVLRDGGDELVMRLGSKRTGMQCEMAVSAIGATAEGLRGELVAGVKSDVEGLVEAVR